MKLAERLIPALVVLLVAAAVAPLCVAAGFDACGDGCCELGLRVSRGSVSQPDAAGALVAVTTGRVAGTAAGWRSLPADRLGDPLGLSLQPLPLRI